MTQQSGKKMRRRTWFIGLIAILITPFSQAGIITGGDLLDQSGASFNVKGLETYTFEPSILVPEPAIFVLKCPRLLAEIFLNLYLSALGC